MSFSVGPPGQAEQRRHLDLVPGAEEEFSSRKEGMVFPEAQQAERPYHQPIHAFSEGELGVHLTNHMERITLATQWLKHRCLGES